MKFKMSVEELEEVLEQARHGEKYRFGSSEIEFQVNAFPTGLQMTIHQPCVYKECVGENYRTINEVEKSISDEDILKFDKAYETDLQPEPLAVFLINAWRGASSIDSRKLEALFPWLRAGQTKHLRMRES